MIAQPIIIKENPKNEMNFDKTEIFQIEQKYNLKISYNEKIIFFEIEEKDQFPKQDFNIFLNLGELGGINRYFNQFESLEEVFDTLKKLIEQNSLFILKEDKLMKIKIKNPLNNKEYYINVPLKEKDLKNEMDSILSYISSLNNRITELEKKVNKLEEYIPIMNEYKLEKEKEKQKQKEKILEGFKDSNIVNKEEQKAIYNWLDKKPKNIKLLLDSKKDGDRTSTFYGKCSGKSPTLILVKTKDGNKFGGYTSIPWKNNGGTQTDKQSFIFSLNKMKKYEVIKPENAIETSIDYFAFGGGTSDFYIEDKCHSHTENYCNSSLKTYNTSEQYELNGGNRDFTVSSYEVYYIEE